MWQCTPCNWLFDGSRWRIFGNWAHRFWFSFRFVIVRLGQHIIFGQFTWTTASCALLFLTNTATDDTTIPHRFVRMTVIGQRIIQETVRTANSLIDLWLLQAVVNGFVVSYFGITGAVIGFTSILLLIVRFVFVGLQECVFSVHISTARIFVVGHCLFCLGKCSLNRRTLISRTIHVLSHMILSNQTTANQTKNAQI